MTNIIDEELRKIKTTVIDAKLPIWEDLSFFQEQEADGRLDNNYFSASYEKALELLNDLDGDKYDVKTLGSIRKDYFTGLEPTNVEPDEEGAIPLIEGTNVMPNVILPSFEKFTKIEDDGKHVIVEDDILLTKDGSPGVVSAVSAELVGALKEEFGYERTAIATHVYKIELKEAYGKYSPLIGTFLNSKLGQALIRRYVSGSVSPTIRRDDVERILVVIPKDEVMVDDARKKLATLQRQAIDYSRYVESSNELVTKMFGRKVELPKLPVNWMPGGKRDPHGYDKE